MQLTVYKNANSLDFVRLFMMYRDSQSWRDMRKRLQDAGFELATTLYEP